jgi:hypothetical protein
MMQANWPRYGNEFATWIGVLLDLAAGRRPLGLRMMSSIIVVVTDVFVEQSFQVPPIEHDHMIEHVPAVVSNPAPRDAILPLFLCQCKIGLCSAPEWRIWKIIQQMEINQNTDSIYYRRLIGEIEELAKCPAGERGILSSSNFTIRISRWDSKYIVDNNRPIVELLIQFLFEVG